MHCLSSIPAQPFVISSSMNLAVHCLEREIRGNTGRTCFLSTKDNRGHLTLKIPRKRQISGYDFEGFFAHQTDSLTVGWREAREWDASETFTSPPTELMVSFRPRARPLPRTYFFRVASSAHDILPPKPRGLSNSKLFFWHEYVG